MSPSEFIPALGRLGSRFYDPVVRGSTRERRVKERLLDIAAVGPGDRVLDLGCGTGTLAIGVGRRQPAAVLVGLDADPQMLQRARRKARANGVDLQLDVGSATALPYPDHSFDIVLSTLFFHHLDPAAKLAAARESARVLQPGGRLLIADWGPPSDPLMRALFVTIQLVDGFATTADNVAGRLPELLRRAGLVDVRERDRYRTILGSMALLEARAPRDERS